MVWLEGLGKLEKGKKKKKIIETQTRDLPVCSTLPQPSMPPHAP
jgi:hypothetical protein